MYHRDGFRPESDFRFEQGFVQVKGIRPNVQEDWFGATQNEGVDCRDECKRREDDFVTGSDVQQEGKHLQGMGARSGQQDLRDAKFLLEDCVAFMGEDAIARDVFGCEGLLDIVQFAANQGWTVKWDVHFSPNQ
jgi:hypothetical protein